MKIITMAVFVFVFLATPVLLLQTVVMPALSQLEQTYAHADDIATRVATGD